MKDLLQRFLTSQYYADTIAFLRYAVYPGASILVVEEDDIGILRQLKPEKGMHAYLDDRPITPPPADGYPCSPISDVLAQAQTYDYIVLNNSLCHAYDVAEFVRSLRPLMHPGTRLVSLTPSRAWMPLFKLAHLCGLRTRGDEGNWISVADLWNTMELGDMDIIKISKRCIIPAGIPLIGGLFNRFIVHLPLLRHLASYNGLVARPMGMPTKPNPSISVLVPARNEAGNIEDAILRIPELGEFTELIFVEGGSTDNTWDVIQQMIAKYPDKRIKCAQQPGKGKNDAVRTGFAIAEGDLLTIVDADLTMPPEELPKFYQAMVDNKCEFANGSRLVYPMENEAMRFFNILGNHFFAVAFSWLLSQRLKDTLCGTKVISRKNYQHLNENRSYFGDFDPFGDFDLIFGAAKLHLKIRDIPIHYKARTYGETNISRWSHGVILLRMVIFALKKIKFV